MKRFWSLFFFLFVGFAIQAQKVQTKAANSVSDIMAPVGVLKGISDSALLDVVQKQSFRYFWNFAHPVSNMSRERSNEAYGYGADVVTTGGTGLGL